MTTSAKDNFSIWLKDKLRDLNTDENIFGSYIIGILEGDETEEEKQEALEGILSEIQTNVDQIVKVIMNKWYEVHPKEESVNKPVPLDVDQQLAKILEAQRLLPTVKERQYTDEEKRIREHILSQYSQTEVSDEDAFSDEDETNKQSGAGGLTGIEKNTNVQDVLALQKEKREQARLDSAAKKQKDKEDRDKQKQLREEKKEKRKTVKGERRR